MHCQQEKTSTRRRGLQLLSLRLPLAGHERGDFATEKQELHGDSSSDSGRRCQEKNEFCERRPTLSSTLLVAHWQAEKHGHQVKAPEASEGEGWAPSSNQSRKEGHACTEHTRGAAQLQQSQKYLKIIFIQNWNTMVYTGDTVGIYKSNCIRSRFSGLLCRPASLGSVLGNCQKI